MRLDATLDSGFFATKAQLKMQPELQPESISVPSAPALKYPKVRIVPEKGVRLLPVKLPNPKTGKVPRRPYGVMWDADGRRPSQFFPSIELLENKIAELNKARRKGIVTLVPTRAEVEQWRMFRSEAGTMPPMKILEEWKALRLAAGKPACGLLVAKAVDDFLAEQEKRIGTGNLAMDTMRQKRVKLNRFRTEFSLRNLADVTKKEIEKWLERIELEVGRAPATVNDHLKKVRELYLHYSDLVPVSPAEKIERRKDDMDRVKVMPVESISKALQYAKNHMPWILPRLAAEVFVGVRASTAGRLEKGLFNIEDRGLAVRKSAIKTRGTHYIQGMPDVFWSWVAVGFDHPRAWDVSKSTYMHDKSDLFDALEKEGVKRIHNALRHSFASYHVAVFENPGLTARILCHRDQEQLWNTYMGRAKKADGQRLFKLRPGCGARI